MKQRQCVDGLHVMFALKISFWAYSDAVPKRDFSLQL
jgi:hypothetical protein